VTEVLKAKETLQRLEAELAKATVHGTQLQVERRKLSFAAHSGDKPARAKLDKLTAESVTIGLEAENLRAAIDEARARLVAAERTADLATARANAGTLKEIAACVEKRGPAIAAALETICDEFVALEAELASARTLGAEIVPRRLVGLGFRDVIAHTLRGAGIELGDIVPPHLRHSAGFLTAAYARGANSWADAVLGVVDAEAA
jgi:hypothetical protein